MASQIEERLDTVAQSFEQGPDEAYLGLSMGAIFASIGLYMLGRRDDALMVAILGTSMALTGMMLKLLGTSRGLALRK